MIAVTVIDTNVLLSSLLSNGNPRRILESFINEEFILATSNNLLNELSLAILKPRLSKRITPDDMTELLELLETKAMIVNPKSKIHACRDSKDNMILECAQEAKADFICSGDKDLIILNPFNNIAILSPKDFLKRLK